MEYIYTLCVGNVCELGAMFCLFLSFLFLCLEKWQILAGKTRFTRTKYVAPSFILGCNILPHMTPH
jgi:hypothetical protein